MESDILLAAATKKEISQLLDISEIKSESTSFSNLPFISAVLGNVCYDLIITGPSVFNTSHGLTAALERRKPKIIIQTGIAGVFKNSGLKIGDIAIASEERYIHTGVESKKKYSTPGALPFQLIKEKPATKSGVYDLNHKYTQAAHEILKKSRLANKCSTAKGPVITVSTITARQKTAAELYIAFSPLMEAMEGAAAAHIAALYNLPFVEIRSGSNYAGDRDKSKWDTDLASERLAIAAGSIIKNIL